MVIAVDGFLKIGDERNGGFAEEEDRTCGGVRERAVG
jgi:hypothetical protein